MIPNLKVELLDTVICKGLPRDEDFQSLDKLADSIAERHKDLKMPSGLQHSYANA